MSKRKRDAREIVLTVGQIAYLDGLCDAFDDLPDGAWQACCVDAIEACGEFKGMDGHEVWLAWCFQGKGT